MRLDWFEPQDCVIARDFYDRGDIQAAARQLLESPHAGHRRSRALLQSFRPDLLKSAAELLVRNEPQAALEVLKLAGQCGPADAEFRNLLTEAEARLSCKLARAEWQAGRIRKAIRLAEEKRLHSAIEWIEPVSDHPEAELIRRDWNDQQRKLEQWLERTAKCLEQNQLQAAIENWRMAAEIDRWNTRVVELEVRLHQHGLDSDPRDSVVMEQAGPQRHHEPQLTISGPDRIRPATNTGPKPPVPEICMSASDDFTDSGLLLPSFRAVSVTSGNQRVLVFTQPEVTAGSAQAADVDLPLQGRLHHRQFQLYRDASEVRLLPYSSGTVRMNDQLCAAGESTVLRSGDRIELEQGRLRFQVLRPDHTVDGTMVLIADPTTPVRVADGGRIDRVVLLDHQMKIAPRQPAHWCLPDLPGEELLLCRDRGRLRIEAEGCIVWMDRADETACCDSARPGLPVQLHVETNLPEAELFGRMWEGQSCPDCVLEFQSFSHPRAGVQHHD